MSVIDEWRTEPTRARWRTFGDEIEKSLPLRGDLDAEYAIEWALGIPGPVFSAPSDRRLALAFTFYAANLTEGRQFVFATEIFHAGRMVGMSRARDRAIRSLLCDAVSAKDPCFFAALAIALACPREARFQRWPSRIDRSLDGAVETAGPEDFGTGELAFMNALAAELRQESPVSGRLVDDRDPVLWSDTRERFEICLACSTSRSSALCGLCVKRRNEVRKRNAIAAELEREPACDALKIFQTFARSLKKWQKVGLDTAWKALSKKLRDFQRDGCGPISRPRGPRNLSSPFGA